MSAASDQQALELAFRAAMTVRKETFLARLPRLLKLAVLLLLLALLGLPFWLGEDAAPPPPAPELQASKTLEPSADLPPDEAETPPPAAETAAAETSDPAKAPPPRVVTPKNDVETAAMGRNDQATPFAPMVPAPDMALSEPAGDGYLPKIGADGRRPWQVYARPFDTLDPRPRIALVMVDMGLSRLATDASLRRLPSTTTFAFDSQSDTLSAWLNRARQDGHETLLSLPMEPLDFPRSDPGPGALLTSLPNGDNVQRLFDILKSGVGYVGVTTMTGSRFVSDVGKLEPIMEVLHERGLLILDTRIAPHGAVRDLALKLHVPVGGVSVVIDSNPTPEAIDAAFARIEQLARANKKIIALASPLPLTIEKIERWAKGLGEKGFVLAPLSAVVEQ